MTHLSDYSFVQRGVANGWFYIWFVIYVFRYDRFQALSIRRIARFELRSIVTLLLLIARPLQLTYDVGSAVIKYEEGFWDNAKTGQIVSRPSFLWSQSNQDRAAVLDYILACGMALLTCIFFLLQSFYHYISKSVTKSSFMSSFEFRLNIVCSLIVLAVFPLIQYVFRNNLAVREAAPQMAFSVVLLVIGFLGVRTHFRFKSLLKVAKLTISESTRGVVEKLEYFKDMNLILTGAMFGTGISLGIASVDGLSPNPIIAHNKFASDFLITNLNFFEFIIWVTLVLIFYPRRSAGGNVIGSSSGGTLSRTAPNLRQGQHSRSVHEIVQASSLSKDRHQSHIPYRAPDGPNSKNSNTELDDVLLESIRLDRYNNRNNSHTRHYNDTYPLTRISEQQDTADLVQLSALKSMYDDPLLAASGSPRSLSQIQQQQHSYAASTTQKSSAQSPPVSPQFRSTSPMPISTRVKSPGAVFGTSVPRQTQPQSPSSSIAQPRSSQALQSLPTASLQVGQQSFILEDAPRSSHQRITMAIQQQQKQQIQQTLSVDNNNNNNSENSYDHPGTSSAAPLRPRKEPRVSPSF